LAKIVELVQLTLGEKMDIKPSKVMAGMEPEKTNAFLQTFYKYA
jgi:hypothetical protein